MKALGTLLVLFASENEAYLIPSVARMQENNVGVEGTMTCSDQDGDHSADPANNCSGAVCKDGYYESTIQYAPTQENLYIDVEGCHECNTKTVPYSCDTVKCSTDSDAICTACKTWAWETTGACTGSELCAGYMTEGDSSTPGTCLGTPSESCAWTTTTALGTPVTCTKCDAIANCRLLTCTSTTDETCLQCYHGYFVNETDQTTCVACAQRTSQQTFWEQHNGANKCADIRCTTSWDTTCARPANGTYFSDMKTKNDIQVCPAIADCTDVRCAKPSSVLYTTCGEPHAPACATGFWWNAPTPAEQAAGTSGTCDACNAVPNCAAGQTVCTASSSDQEVQAASTCNACDADYTVSSDGQTCTASCAAYTAVDVTVGHTAPASCSMAVALPGNTGNIVLSAGSQCDIGCAGGWSNTNLDGDSTYYQIDCAGAASAGDATTFSGSGSTVPTCDCLTTYTGTGTIHTELETARDWYNVTGQANALYNITLKWGRICGYVIYDANADSGIQLHLEFTDKSQAAHNTDHKRYYEVTMEKISAEHQADSPRQRYQVKDVVIREAHYARSNWTTAWA